MQLHQVALPVQDLDRATAFYSELVGTPPTATFDPPGLVFFDLDGIRLLLDRQAGPPATIYLRVPDVAHAVAGLAGSGVTVAEPAHVVYRDDDGLFGPAGEDEWLAAIRDSEGNLVCLAGRSRQVPPGEQLTAADSSRQTAATTVAQDGQDAADAPEDGRWAGELAHRMGIEITEATAERLVGTMPVVGNRQPMGLLHGGANAVLAETLGSIHAFLLGEGTRSVVGLDLNCTHHRSATEGTVTGVCTPITAGRTIASFEIVISDEAGRRLCTARLTCMFRSVPAASGRS